MVKNLFLFLLLLVWPLCLRASGKSKLCEKVFSDIFHSISQTATTTTLRQELKVTVKADSAIEYENFVRNVLGDKNLEPRDQAPPGQKFITNTDYLPTFEVPGKDGARLRAKIRIRTYIIVPENDRVVKYNGKSLSELERVSLVDGDPNTVYSKLEFKVGHPELKDGELQDQFGVVDKPGVVLSQKDITTLFESKESYLKNKDEIIKRGLKLSKSKSGVSKKVNNEQELKEMVERIGLMHEQGMTDLKPETNIRYVRTAYVVPFETNSGKKVSVQLTFDQDVHMWDILKDRKVEFPAKARVIELKIPTEYANLSDEELITLGLKDLVQIRHEYNQLTPLTGFERQKGKSFNAKQILEDDI